jgi:uncharacterized protein YdeI (YjbR/CyaY-like superfamily)
MAPEGTLTPSSLSLREREEGVRVTSTDHTPHLPVESAADLAAWLAADQAQPGSIWLVLWRKPHGPRPTYQEIVRTTLSWGWIDSLPRKLDATRTPLRLSPRRPGSAWSAINKAHVAALTAAGRMQKPGLAAVARAKADGTWHALDGADADAMPPDLAEALAATPDAARHFANFPPSSRRGILEWIALARTPATRARRVAEAAARAAQNRKANFPAGRDAGPTPKDRAP